MADKINKMNGSEIAVIGMAGRFPEAKNIEEFWENLKKGKESISFISEEEIKTSNGDLNWLKDSNFVKTRGGVLEDRELFDATFFGYTPKEAEIMDPQVRIFLESAWGALEDAGYEPERYEGTIGLYAGAGPSIYWENLAALSGKSEDLGYFAAGHLNSKDFLSTQVAYKLNLKGPCIAVQTACSTSLVAIHLASQGVLNGECNMALAGGIKIAPQNRMGYLYQEGMIASPDGHCRAFDAKAKGTLAGEGVGVVLLKTLEDAVTDGDHIYAIIKGTAINNDGLRKIGYTAPSIEGQAEVIHMAQQVAEVPPGSIAYVEAHGTATELGDPVEIEALETAFNTGKKNFCALGSVKTNIGHLDTAAGVAGFIKTVLALKNRLIPPSLHFETPNPRIDFKNSPFYVNNCLREWKSNGNPRRAGVSSFGIGGTNAHVVLEEWPEKEGPQVNKKEQAEKAEREYQLLLLSAKTPAALDRVTENLARYLKANREISLADAAYTLMVGRKEFECRRMLVCKDGDSAIAALSTPGTREVHTFYSDGQEKTVIFMFPGLGSQYVNMGRELYEKEPVFREAMDQGFEILESLVDYDIKGILYPAEESAALHEKIKDFEVAQLVIFIFENALAQSIMKWGVKPGAMIGYSFGEYAAACTAGVFTLEDALRLIVTRGKLIGKLPTAAMLSVPLSKEELKPQLNEKLSIAIDNGSTCIVVGTRENIDALEERLKMKRYMCIPMGSSHAIHSKMMTPILPAYEESAGKIKMNKPQVPYISNLTGTWITAADVMNPAYWARHLGETVRFAEGIKELLKNEGAVFVEVGPGRDLNALVGRYFDNTSKYQALNLVRAAEQDIPDIYYLLNKIGLYWLYGNRLEGMNFYSQPTRNRISLPTYPFEKEYYWIEGDLLKMMGKSGQAQPSPGIADWAYLPLWKRSFPGIRNKPRYQTKSHCLIFSNEIAIGKKLEEKLVEIYQEVVIVKMGNAFEKPVSDSKPRIYTINPKEFSHYDILFGQLRETGTLPHKIVHCWNLTAGEGETVLNRETFDAAQYLGFYSLLYMVKAIESQEVKNEIRISFLTNHSQEVTGTESLCPGKAPALGLLKSIPQEYPGITCRSIDIVLPEPASPGETTLIDLLVEEFTGKGEDVTVAFRDHQRWVQFYDPFHLEPRPTGGIQEATGHLQGKSRLRKKGVYLVTGGLGKVGLVFAELLVKRVQARVILTGRSAFPGKEEWSQWLQMHDQSDPISLKIKQLQRLGEMGGEVLYFRADAAEEEQMRRVVTQVETRLGKINGVIHAAGITEGESTSLINQLTENNCGIQFIPKVYGTLVLENLFKNEKLDFCWMMSSVSCVLGGLGLGAYAGANLFMDIFVKKYNRSKEPGSRWFSLNWDAMDEEKSSDLFERIFELEEIDQLVISTNGNLQQRIDKWIGLKSLHGEMKSKNQEKNAQPFKTRPDLMNPYVGPRNLMEKNITEIWQRLFGYEPIGIDDDFFELGGDSLKIINLVSRLKKEVGPIAMIDVLSNPTISKLAALISERNKAKELMAEVYENQLLDRLECMVKLNQGRNQKNIFIIHAQHGMVYQYKDLAHELEADYNVYGIQARGLIPGTKMTETPGDLIEDYLQQILEVQPQGPYIIGGYCVGVGFGYCIVLELEKRNQEIERFIEFDGSAIFPGYYLKGIEIIKYLPAFAKKGITFLNKKRYSIAKSKRESTGNEHKTDEWVDFPGLPAVNKKLLNRIHLLIDHILPLEFIKTPILSLRPELSRYSALTEADYDRITKSKATLIEVPGDHDTMFMKPNVIRLAEVLKNNLRENNQ